MANKISVADGNNETIRTAVTVLRPIRAQFVPSSSGWILTCRVISPAMSKVVEIVDLGEALASYQMGYLLTSSGDGRVKAVSFSPSLATSDFMITAPGRGSCANAAANPTVTLLFPPLVQPGFTLIVDGAATVSDDSITVRAISAILHRPA